MLLREWILKLDKFKQEGLYSLFNGSNLHPRLNWLVKTRWMKLETLTVFLEKRRNNTTNLSWGSNIETVQDELCSNMKVFQDSLCLILDLEGFFINKTFHARELGYFTWNQEHGRHAFFVSVLYKTLCDKDKRKVNFVISKIHGFAYQPSQTEHAQNPRIAGTLITFSFPEPSFPLTSDWKTIPAAGQKDRELWGRECLDQGLVPRLQCCRENHSGLQRRSREKDALKQMNIPLLNLETVECPKYCELKYQTPLHLLLPSCGFHADDSMYHCPVTEYSAFWHWYKSGN